MSEVIEADKLHVLGSLVFSLILTTLPWNDPIVRVEDLLVCQIS